MRTRRSEALLAAASRIGVRRLTIRDLAIRRLAILGLAAAGAAFAGAAHAQTPRLTQGVAQVDAQVDVQVDAQAGSSLPAGWRSHAFAGFRLASPGDWRVETKDGTLTAHAPDRKRMAMAWWWFPDEPLLGYPDILAHRKITVAGRPALWIHVRAAGRDNLSVTFDTPRGDRKRLRVMLDADGELKADDALFAAMIASLAFDGDPPAPVASPTPSRAAAPDRSASVRSAPVRRDPDRVAPAGATARAAEASSRVWLGPVSVEPPQEWRVRRENGGASLVFERPDGAAQIVTTLSPQDRPTPARGIATIEQTTVGGEPATRMRLREGSMDVDQIVFDEPLPDGRRVILAYRVVDEPLEEGRALFELTLAGLSRALPAPKGVETGARGPRVKGDPFKGLTLDDFITSRR
jgi:hypothetical protein